MDMSLSKLWEIVTDRRVPAELGQESQASSCLRKGTPLASRVAQGVSPRFPGPLLIRTRCPVTSSKVTLWMKAQHEGALTPPCIIRKNPQGKGVQPPLPLTVITKDLAL